MIKSLQEQTDTTIEIEEDGTIYISCIDGDGHLKAKEMIEAMTQPPEVGRLYKEAKVVSVKDFGGFVEIVPGVEGLCHVSELSEDYVKHVEDVCKVGDIIPVKLILIDEQGRLSSRARPPWRNWASKKRESPGRKAKNAREAETRDRDRDDRRPRSRRRDRRGGRSVLTERAGDFVNNEAETPEVRLREPEAGFRRFRLSVFWAGGMPRSEGRVNAFLGGMLASLLLAGAGVAVMLPQCGPQPRRKPPAEAADPDEELTKLTGELAHEIKNPLSTIKVNLQLAKEALDDVDLSEPSRVLWDQCRHSLAGATRKIAVVQKETDRLEQILDGFLKYVRRPDLQLATVDLNELVSDMVDFYSPQAYSHSLTVRQSLAPRPLMCRADPGALKQVLLNLFINSQQAMDKGGELMIRTARQGRRAVIQVNDTGRRHRARRDFRPSFSRTIPPIRAAWDLGWPRPRRSSRPTGRHLGSQRGGQRDLLHDRAAPGGREFAVTRGRGLTKRQGVTRSGPSIRPAAGPGCP